MEDGLVFAAFAGERLIAKGTLSILLPDVKRWSDHHHGQVVLVFEEASGRQVDFDLRGSIDEVLARVSQDQDVAPAGPGRPKLGVVSREVTLLPRHWEWLEQQPSGASATLRRLVEHARKEDPELSFRNKADAACRFLYAMAGSLTGYEESTRALYAGDQATFMNLTSDWPEDIRAYADHLASGAFSLRNAQ